MGHKVHLENNTYHGQLQLHQTAGNEIDIVRNIYYGQVQIHELLVTQVKQSFNTYNKLPNNLPIGNCARFIQSVYNKSKAGSEVALRLVRKITRKCSTFSSEM